jgi:eukaryotic translation initiation factor 2C
MELVRRLQEVVAPKIFSPPAVYDGRKNLFATRALPFPGGAQTHDVRDMVVPSPTCLT